MDSSGEAGNRPSSSSVPVKFLNAPWHYGSKPSASTSQERFEGPMRHPTFMLRRDMLYYDWVEEWRQEIPSRQRWPLIDWKRHFFTISKMLSKILRHTPKDAKTNLRRDGFIEVGELLKKQKVRGSQAEPHH